METARQTSAKQQALRQAFYERISNHHLAPLWEVIGELLAREPTTNALPHCWAYETMRPLLLESGQIISADEAERRVLVLENPGLRGGSKVSDTLYAGLQLILPGETAPAHRHTPAAIRMIVEGSGAYTSVDGERVYMEPGDLILTPSWTWHDHGHEGDGPMIWLDVLDLPLLGFLGPRFSEDYAQRRVTLTRASGASDARYGANMRPVGDRDPRLHSPVLRYPYARSRAALEQLGRAPELDPCFGAKLEYINPLSGDPAVPTLSTFLQWLPAGFESQRYRATDSAVYSVIEGRGRTRVGEGGQSLILRWGPRDHFVVPRWMPHTHHCDEDAVLFSASDKGVQEKLGLWRESRGC